MYPNVLIMLKMECFQIESYSGAKSRKDLYIQRYFGGSLKRLFS